MGDQKSKLRALEEEAFYAFKRGANWQSIKSEARRGVALGKATLRAEAGKGRHPKPPSVLRGLRYVSWAATLHGATLSQALSALERGWGKARGSPGEQQASPHEAPQEHEALMADRTRGKERLNAVASAAWAAYLGGGTKAQILEAASDGVAAAKSEIGKSRSNRRRHTNTRTKRRRRNTRR